VIYFIIESDHFEGARMLTVTESAATRLKELMAGVDANGDKYDQETVGLRVFVQGGGCSGFQYGLVLASDGNEEYDKQEGEVPIESNSIQILVDPISSRYLDGSTIDFIDNLVGGFTVKNPNAKSTCGCGQSFQA